MSGMELDRVKGPIESLCKEIGFRFDERMERPELVIAFCGVLLGVVQDMHDMQDRICAATEGMTKAPSEDSGEALARAWEMLEATDKIQAAAELHAYVHVVNPEDKYPTDHMIDMVSSIASGVRFGLEENRGYGTRHMAEAANHIWKHRYGVHLFDQYTSAWENDWARAQFEQAMLSLIPALKARDTQA